MLGDLNTRMIKTGVRFSLAIRVNLTDDMVLGTLAFHVGKSTHQSQHRRGEPNDFAWELQKEPFAKSGPLSECSSNILCCAGPKLIGDILFAKLGLQDRIIRDRATPVPLVAERLPQLSDAVYQQRIRRASEGFGRSGGPEMPAYYEYCTVLDCSCE